MAHFGAGTGIATKVWLTTRGVQVSRLLVIIVSAVVGIVLALGATFTASAVIGQTPTPSNQAAYNYGG
jgi:sterol desaturase/sphingolipid hydroxylase (fatty acid hydroxylase superfamily)